ncbi:alanine:cation symporter family protein [bacterium SCSIO 12643]|nr:alanine:cation symporter family protein [bacterium SCSIO 12643]
MKNTISLLLVTLGSITTVFAQEASDEKNIGQIIDSWFAPIVDVLAVVFFADPLKLLGIDIGADVPFIVVWLVFGAVFFTFKMRFINFRGFKHSIQLVQGKFDDPNDKGEVSHFQALTTALSATVGLGNIASVAVAITIGGPGATFWMILAGLLGMSTKFTECTLGVKYREIHEDGSISGGPMYYLTKGLNRRNMEMLGKALALLFAVLAVLASFGGGNMFQSNQAFSQMAGQLPAIAEYGFWFGLGMAILVGVVIIGGIQSIAKVTEKIVPFMAFLYVISAIIILGMNYDRIFDAFGLIIQGAFAPDSIAGGFVGVLMTGFKRASFSNEAGVGSAAIAHSAVKTHEPVSEGFVALLEPFIDTVIICTMTALVIIITGQYQNVGLEGAQLTSAAFESAFNWFPMVLAVAVFLFAFSTMISWSYYGLKAWTYLFGESKLSENTYKMIFLVFVVVGASTSMSAVITFSDMMILAMAFPNIIGLLIMSSEVREDLRVYVYKVKTGVIKQFK